MARAAAIALWLAYLLSALLSPSVPRAALGEVLKQGLYLGVFFAASDVVWSASRGLSAAAGLIPSNFILADRLYTYAGYPNSAGALFAAAFLLGVGLRRTGTKLPAWLGALFGVGQWALLTGVVLTLSRGAWVIFPFVAAWPRGWRLALALELLLLALPALAVAPPWVGSLQQRTPGAYLFLAGILLAALAGWLSRRIEGLGRRRQVLVLVTLAVVVVGAAAGSYQAGHLPEELASRLTGFTLTDRSHAEAVIWLSLVEERRGDREKAAAYLAEARSIVVNTDAIRADLGPLLGKADGP